MKSKFRHFLNDESGAVTIDWVVLSAGVIALGMLVFNIITTQSVQVGANYVSTSLSNAGNQSLN
jgi:Flp pilus assembly pilin Flp